jgi:hypothetical protein
MSISLLSNSHRTVLSKSNFCQKASFQSPTELNLSKYSEISFENINFRYFIGNLVYPLSIYHAKSTFASAHGNF